MNPSPLTINDSLEVVFRQDGASTSCRSSVFDLAKGGYQLLWPTHDGVRFPVHNNQQVNLIYLRDDATYSIKGVVAELQNGPVPTIIFRPSGEVERIQRREYCRVRASLPVLLVEALSQKASGQGKLKGINITTRTVDISGSGLRIHVGFPIPRGTVFRVKLELEPGEPPVDLTARSVYSANLPPTNGRALYQVGIEFTAVSEPKRRKIVRQVFKIQQTSLSGTTDPAPVAH
jgi:c-di-GMP-binding flagellar brake protein YcgR